MRRRQQRQKISRTQLDFILLEVFGPRYLPDEVAARIALRAEFARGLADAFDRRTDLGPPRTAAVAAVVA